MGIWVVLSSQPAFAESWQWSSGDTSSSPYRGGLYLLPGDGSGNNWQPGSTDTWQPSSPNASYGSGDSDTGAYGASAVSGYSGSGGYAPYGSGYGGDPGGWAPSGYSGQPYGGTPAQSGPLRTGVYPLEPAGSEQQYGTWGATGTQASSWYSGGGGKQPELSPQYRFRTDPQISKPQATDLPKFRPYDSQPGSAFGPSSAWQSSGGGVMAPAPVFRPLENDEPASSGARGRSRSAPSDGWAGAGVVPPPLYPGLGAPLYPGTGWGYPGASPWAWDDGGAWPGLGTFGLAPFGLGPW